MLPSHYCVTLIIGSFTARDGSNLLFSDQDLKTGFCAACVYEAIVIKQVVVIDLEVENEIVLLGLARYMLSTSDMLKDEDLEIISAQRLHTEHFTIRFTLRSKQRKEEDSGTAHLLVEQVPLLVIRRESKNGSAADNNETLFGSEANEDNHNDNRFEQGAAAWN